MARPKEKEIYGRGRPPERHDPARRIVEELENIGRELCRIHEAITKLTQTPPVQGGNFDMHVTEVIYPPKEQTMPPIDHTPALDLASSSVRAKLSVVNPRNAQNVRVTSVTWSTDDETELPLEAAPDSTVQVPDPNWVDPGDGSVAPLIEYLDPADNLPNHIFSVYANTPLTPEPGAKADGTVTCSAPGMASIDKLIRYGDAPLGHFTLEAVEAPEV